MQNYLAGNFPSAGYNGNRDQIRLGRIGASGPFVFWKTRSVFSHHRNPSLEKSGSGVISNHPVRKKSTCRSLLRGA